MKALSFMSTVPSEMASAVMMAKEASTTTMVSSTLKKCGSLHDTKRS